MSVYIQKFDVLHQIIQRHYLPIAVSEPTPVRKRASRPYSPPHMTPLRVARVTKTLIHVFSSVVLLLLPYLTV